ncbi:MAG TPA: amidase family protein, partial [Alphaproteobacteria bacterium]
MVPPADADLCALPAADLAAAIRDGRLTAEQIVRACLARIAELEPTVQAWVYLDTEHALDQARRADAWRAAGRPLGSLHGVP